LTASSHAAGGGVVDLYQAARIRAEVVTHATDRPDQSRAEFFPEPFQGESDTCRSPIDPLKPLPFAEGQARKVISQAGAPFTLMLTMQFVVVLLLNLNTSLPEGGDMPGGPLDFQA
jgi:hypothetical protein